MSGFILWQLEGNYPVSIYRFPFNVFLPAQQHITVWASAAKVSHNPPTDLVWKGRVYFRSNPQCVTVLSRPNGQPVASYTAVEIFSPSTANNRYTATCQSPIPLYDTKVSETAPPRTQCMSTILDLSCKRLPTVPYHPGVKQRSPPTPRTPPGWTHLRSRSTFVTCYPSRLNTNSPFVRLVAQTSVRSKHGFKFLSHVPFTCDLF
ncbi:lamin tail domain-containing protein 2 [Spea bombifrons]|uniref:lamin tail domain-containing protein 2 n=1 Tax=Spea bombifrons TaxID=233779 RepID=UPI00234A1916|nr:lamin tail domain-containing protein 2 [Spea bombifrons]